LDKIGDSSKIFQDSFIQIQPVVSTRSIKKGARVLTVPFPLKNMQSKSFVIRSLIGSKIKKNKNCSL